MPTISRRQAMAYAVVVLAILALVGRSLVGGGNGGVDSVSPNAAPVLVVDEENPTDLTPTAVLVHVAGAVRHPGVYELAAGSRVADALERAGGPRARAALENINLAAELLDGQQVVVPSRPRSGAEGSDTQVAIGPDGSSATAAAAGAGGGPISLSLASATQLQELPGVGPVTAERIIAHRVAHGPFRAVDELAAVSGIGPARIEAIRDLVTP